MSRRVSVTWCLFRASDNRSNKVWISAGKARKWTLRLRISRSNFPNIFAASKRRSHQPGKGVGGDRREGGRGEGAGGYVEPAPSGTASMPAVLALSLLGTCSGLHYSRLGKSLGHQLSFIIRRGNAHTFTFHFHFGFSDFFSTILLGSNRYSVDMPRKSFLSISLAWL